MQRLLMALGALLILVGLIWPWIVKSGLGRLPGDIDIQRDGFRFYFPLTTSIVVSVILSLLLWLFFRHK
jgi:hypothetical protein